ncbi:protein-arginine deiminase domain-containing protein [Streptomyces heilongjiangensis]|uniref:Protein-arginine deiminase family protein n=1 Tax=Streptomyces heilongjiangensis TaxID=945052 RepID=A0ABW1B2N9_9ACTN|nr:protein-arginine deiminase domain-containing protein [Streptomyces heilongjiangensis]MDC2946878.1 protein-arginine deiminase domain-containing protein [Streptomyces heilongjiangensis]
MNDVRARTATALAIALAAVSGTVPAATAADTGGIRADIRADVNRDGAVDVTGGSDVPGKTTWNSGRGAIFLPNIGDEQRRCRTKTPDGRWLSNARLQACNDAQGDVARAPQYLAPLRTVPVGDVSDAATGGLRLVGAGKSKVRLFLRRGDTWTYVTAGTRVTAAELRAGLRLGLDGRDVVREDWDGRITVRFTVTDGDRTSTDEVMLRVAPVLTQHHLQRAEQALVVDGSSDDPNQRKFAKEFAEEVRKAGITKPTHRFKDGSDIWAQDFVEPGYVSMPGPGGKPRVLRVMIRSAQMDRDAGKQVFELRGPGVGVVQVNKGKYDQINSTGNLETVPPYAHKGKSYPAGRIITGRHGSRLPAHTAFLKAQQAQDPLVLETGWLGIGHVDEFVQFLPADTPRGWKIGIADPDGALALLRKAQRDGHGHTKVFSVPRSYAQGRVPTIDQALSDKRLLKDNAYAARKIKENLALLRRETGVTDAEIVRIPAMFERFAGFPGQGGPSDGAPKLAAYHPGAINGVVLAPHRYLAPKQWGPVVDGKDILAAAVTKAYAKAGMRVRYLDDWRTHHVFGGEVHCGTNTIRAAGTAWWSSPE